MKNTFFVYLILLFVVTIAGTGCSTTGPAEQSRSYTAYPRPYVVRPWPYAVQRPCLIVYNSRRQVIGRYDGYTSRGLPHGKGQIQYNNGAFYYGNFYYGQPHGWGVVGHRSGGYISGFWKNGVFIKADNNYDNQTHQTYLVKTQSTPTSQRPLPEPSNPGQNVTDYTVERLNPNSQLGGKLFGSLEDSRYSK